jgi:DNA polymerase I-like protein with 3'-5' exonuclease and polymerase domains
MSRTARPNPDQMPMFPPPRTWRRPAELPDWRGRVIALDTETRDDGLAAQLGSGWPYAGRGWICGVSAAVAGESVYLPVLHPETECFDADAVGRWVADHVRAAPRVVMQNAPYDIGWLWREWGLDPPEGEKLADVMCMAYMLDENQRSYGLDALCRRRGLAGKDESALRDAAQAYGLDPKRDMWRLPAGYVGTYAEADAVSTLALYDDLLPALEREDLVPAFQLEMDLLPVTFAMRRRGIRVDLDELARVQATLRARRDAAVAEVSRRLAVGRAVTVRDLAGWKFLERAFQAEGVEFPRTAKSGQGSFSKKWTERHEHWLPRAVAEIHKLDGMAEKFLGDYVAGYASGGRVHAEINQYRRSQDDDSEESQGTSSYRFSYSDPPLQQMPARDGELAPLIRGVFLPEPGEVWAAPDYSQQEYRLIVHFAAVCGMRGAEKAVEAYRENPRTDFHDYVAQITGLDRKPAKDSNFAKAFGAGVPKFALMIGKSEDEARAIYEQYDEEMPFVSEFGKFCSARAGRRGYLRLIDGARAHFDSWEVGFMLREKYAAAVAAKLPLGPTDRAEAERRRADSAHPWHGERLRRAGTHKAMNRLIQGSAARMTKQAMRAAARAGILPLIQMHDEIGASVGAARQVEVLAECMRDVVRLVVPVVVDAECGPTWGRAAKRGDYGATFDEAMALVSRS